MIELYDHFTNPNESVIIWIYYDIENTGKKKVHQQNLYREISGKAERK